jgi:hypothetical protein
VVLDDARVGVAERFAVLAQPQRVLEVLGGRDVCADRREELQPELHRRRPLRRRNFPLPTRSAPV